jgi:alkaline phosphatase
MIEKILNHCSRHLSYLLCITIAGVLLGCFSRASQSPPAKQGVVSPRNIILIIGDGMGPQQLALADLYYQRTGDTKAACLARFIRTSVQGLHVSTPARSLVNDSACAASQLAGGCLCEPRYVSIDIHGNRCASVALQAKQLGKKVGLVSDTRITHATPAAFAATVVDRDLEHSIASQLAESSFDLMLSGGEAFFVSTPDQCFGNRCASNVSPKNYRDDGRNLLAEVTARGIQVVSTRNQLEACRTTPVLGLFAPLFMHNAFREGEDAEPSLAVMTARALELLDNPNGFFLMVEAGQIDFAGHSNDAGWTLREMLRLSETIEVVERFYRNRNDTLVVLTADHETGGMGLSYREAQPKLSQKRQEKELDFLSSDVFSALRAQQKSVAEAMGKCKLKQSFRSLATKAISCTLSELGEGAGRKLSDQVSEAGEHQHQRDAACNAFEPYYPYSTLSDVAFLGRELGAANGVVWATGTHTSAPVPLIAKGVGQERFVGWQHAREVGEKLLDLIE